MLKKLSCVKSNILKTMSFSKIKINNHAKKFKNQYCPEPIQKSQNAYENLFFVKFWEFCSHLVCIQITNKRERTQTASHLLLWQIKVHDVLKSLPFLSKNFTWSSREIFVNYSITCSDVSVRKKFAIFELCCIVRKLWLWLS
jgi:hypothetical protein